MLSVPPGNGRLALWLRTADRWRCCNRCRTWRAGGAISPGAVGFDINCGVRAVALNLEASDIPNLEKLARRLNGRIPAGGSGKGGIHLTESKLDLILQGGLNELESIDVVQHHARGTVESDGSFEVEDLTISHRAKQRGLRALGTLGSGNHFLELQRIRNRR